MILTFTLKKSNKNLAEMLSNEGKGYNNHLVG
jgi:hypothetical protein